MLFFCAGDERNGTTSTGGSRSQLRSHEETLTIASTCPCSLAHNLQGGKGDNVRGARGERGNHSPLGRGWTYRVVTSVTVHFRPDLCGAARKRHCENSLRRTVRACETRDALAGARDNSKKRSQSMSDSW